jgi:carbon storage regulator CsrA
MHDDDVRSLILSRKKGETVHIAPRIAITVMTLSPGRVRLRICAPRDVLISREELLPVSIATTEPEGGAS